MGHKSSKGGKPSGMLVTPRGIARFLALFLLAYGASMAPWPGLGSIYAAAYRTGASLLFRSFGSQGIVRFEPLPGRPWEINVALYNRARAGRGGIVPGIQTCHDTRDEGYLYVAFLTALILAHPLPWRRKGRALLWGMALIHVLIVLKLGLRLFHAFSREPLALVTLSPFAGRVLSAAHQVFAVNITFGFVVAIVIWLLVCFRREDWLGVMRLQKGSTEAKAIPRLGRTTPAPRQSETSAPP